MARTPWSNAVPVQGGPFSNDLQPGGISYGADEAIGRKSRELALAGLDTAIADAHRDPTLDLQRSNIAAHGTIETPQDFARREGQQTAADSLDPANPFGKMRGHDEAFGLEKAALSPGGLRATEAAGQTQRDVAGIVRQTALDESGDKLAGSMYDSDVTGEARVEGELANQVIGGQFKNPAERDSAITGFLTALDQLRKRQAAVQ